MPGGKSKLAQLFTSQLEVSKSGDGISIHQILSGSATIAGGGGVSGCAALNHNACVIGEITVSDLSPCDMLFVSVWETTACLNYKGEALAGDGQASIVMRYAGCSASMDKGWSGTARYIALKV